MGSNHCAMCVWSSLFLCSFAIPFLLDLKKCTNYVVNLQYGHFGRDVDKRNAEGERGRNHHIQIQLNILGNLNFHFMASSYFSFFRLFSLPPSRFFCV